MKTLPLNEVSRVVEEWKKGFLKARTLKSEITIKSNCNQAEIPSDVQANKSMGFGQILFDVIRSKFSIARSGVAFSPSKHQKRELRYPFCLFDL